MRPDLPSVQNWSTGLVDVLDRVLDTGLVVAGDIKVSLTEVELLTIRLRLLGPRRADAARRGAARYGAAVRAVS